MEIGSGRSSRNGHEVAYHGYTHRSPAGLSREEEEDEIVRGRGVLESLGAEVVGCRCPSWEFSANTLSLLEAQRSEYSSNMMDDIRPYRHENNPDSRDSHPVDHRRRSLLVVRRN